MLKSQVKITGEVQGVGLRYLTSNKAKELGLRGFVQNLTNGEVYLEVEGELDKIDLILKFVTTNFKLTDLERKDIDIDNYSRSDFNIKT